MLRKSNT